MKILLIFNTYKKRFNISFSFLKQKKIAIKIKIVSNYKQTLQTTFFFLKKRLSLIKIVLTTLKQKKTNLEKVIDLITYLIINN